MSRRTSNRIKKENIEPGDPLPRSQMHCGNHDSQLLLDAWSEDGCLEIQIGSPLYRAASVGDRNLIRFLHDAVDHEIEREFGKNGNGLPEGTRDQLAALIFKKQFGAAMPPK